MSPVATRKPKILSWFEPLRFANVKLKGQHELVCAETGRSITMDGLVPLDAIPDLRDWSTRMLCLRELATRTGLDPECGVLWEMENEPDEAIWTLRTSVIRPGEIERVRWKTLRTRDPLLALATALPLVPRKLLSGGRNP